MSLMTLLSRVADAARAPRCRQCGAATAFLTEVVVPGTPPVLESVYHCEPCGADTVRCLLASALD
jgi:hypothetical protein